jgi:predicted ATPase/DNA-binding SARP family transcriptional activator
MLLVRLLGAAQVNLGQEQIEIPAGKTSALLYYLAYKNDWVSRDELIYLLWPESPEGAARKNLRQLLSTIRRLPYAESMETEENRLRWQVSTDVKQFREAIEKGSIATATQLYQGELLQGYAVDLPEFEQWLNMERQQLQASWQEAALAFVADLEHSGRYLQAADLLARVRKVDPLDEALLQRYLTNAALAGHKDKALAAFEAFRQALVQEYEVEPEEESLRLIERIKRGETPETGAAAKERTRAEAEAKPKHNLPSQPTPFIGREADKGRASELLNDPHRRLLTLVGPGGIGKTRLAIEIAQVNIGSYEDGVYFVNLAPVTSAELIITAIADAVGFSFYGATSPKEQLFTFLQDKHLLLVLDNFEQLLTAAPLVAELLAISPKLRLLVTSRAALRLYGEQEYSVPPLSLPDPNQMPSIDRMSQYEAVALFIQRALAVKPDFQVTNDNAPAVAEICHRLDGLALAIELAAARTRLFPPQALLSRLSSRLQTLTGGAQNLPSRQQTLRNALDWSYDLLSPAEQKLFARMSVFTGGRSFEAIEAVCNPNHDLGMDVLEGVDSLVSKNLLRQEDRNGEPRFIMLETLHEYAREKLEGGGEAEVIKRLHAEFFLALTEEAEPHLSGSEQVVWLERLEREHDNLRAALQWLLGNGAGEWALRLTGALWWFWVMRGFLSEGREWLTKALASGTARNEARATALLGAGTLALLQGGYDAARSLLQESLALHEALGDKRGMANTLNNLGTAAHNQTDLRSARSYFEQGLMLAEEIGNQRLVANLLNNLGTIATDENDDAQARSFYEQGLAVATEVGDKYIIGSLHVNLATAAYLQGDYPSARPLLEQGLTITSELGDKEGVCFSLEIFAGLCTKEGNPEVAARLFGGAAAIREETGLPLPPNYRPRYENDVNITRSQLGDQRFEALLTEGRVMMFQDIITYVLHQQDD